MVNNFAGMWFKIGGGVFLRCHRARVKNEILLVLPLTVVLGLAAVTGDSDCPRREAVEARLEKIGVELGQKHAEIAREDRMLIVRLRGESDEVIGESQIDTTHGSESNADGEEASCADLANAAAVVIASFLTNAEPNAHALRLPRKPTPSRVDPTPAPPPRSAPPVSRSSPNWEVSAAFVGALAETSFAPGGRIGAAVGRNHFLARFGIWATGTRDLTLGSGHASWLRAAVDLGPSFRFKSAHLVFDLSAEFLAALVKMSGSGFKDNFVTYNFDPGLGAGLRLGVRAKMILPYIGLDFVGWLRREGLAVGGNQPASASLPQFDILFVAGFAVGVY